MSIHFIPLKRISFVSRLVPQAGVTLLLLAICAIAWTPGLYASTFGDAESLNGNVMMSAQEDCPRHMNAGVPKTMQTNNSGVRSSGVNPSRSAVSTTYAMERDNFHPWRTHPFGGEAAGELVQPDAMCTFHSEKMEPHENGFSRIPGKNGKATFGIDEQVRGNNYSSIESHPSIASDRDGNLWCAFQDNYSGNEVIIIYWSTDGGEHWIYYGYIDSAMSDLLEPSIAVGCGTKSCLLITYIRDTGSNIPNPIVASAPLHTTNFTFKALPYWSNWEAYAKPVIWTDCVGYDDWYAYVTCEGIFESATENINIAAWRSKDMGHSWDDVDALLGMYDTMTWRDPEGGFGTTEKRLFITCFNDSTDTLYCVRSGGNTGPWQTEQVVYAMPDVPIHAVDPEVEAAVNHDNVLICCTKTYNGNDNIGTSWSTDCGASWGYLYSLSGYTSNAEWAPALHANPGGGSWHLAYTDNARCYYSSAPQDYSNVFQLTPDTVSDAGTVSVARTKKGISSTWNSDCASIAWVDFRDGAPDYDIYFDRASDYMRKYVPEQYATIQEAINTSGTGYHIHVNSGTYYENLTVYGLEGQIRSVYGPKWSTIDGNGFGVTISCRFGETLDTIIEGFTITNGDVGGVSCVYNSCPTIRGNVITGNTALNKGAGLNINGSAPLVVNNMIVDNHTLGTSGGGVYCIDATPTFMNCVIADNSANGSGGGICSDDSKPTIYNCTIADNHADSRGGGLAVFGAVAPTMRNTIIWGNSASVSNPHIYAHDATPNVYYSDVEGGWVGSGCIDEDPLFEDAATGDYHLTRFSPCINMGNDSSSIPYDNEWLHRPIMNTTDIGAYEFNGYHTFVANEFEIYESEQSDIELFLEAGSQNQYRAYMIFGGMTGTAPGVPLPQNGPLLPINFDIFTNLVMDLMNSAVFPNFYGQLNHLGQAQAGIDTLGPLPPGSVGASMYFAYACNYKYPDGWFASNPIRIEIKP